MRPFENAYFDKLMLSARPYTALRELIGLSREALAKKFDISAHSIRRYETTNKPPLWYYFLLRLAAGDLSFYGSRWDNCHIDVFSARLVTPYDKYKAYWPNELNAKTAGIHQKAAALVADSRDEIAALKAKIAELEESNAALMFRLLRYERGQISKNSGKVVPLFNYK